MPESKPHLIILSYYDPGSGFFTVITNIAHHLRQHFSIHYLGIGYEGDVRQGIDWTLYPGNKDTKDLAASQCVELAQHLQTGKILIINDLWAISVYKPHLTALKNTWDIFAYTPVDGHLLNTQMVNDTQFLNALVVYTEFARAEIARVRAQNTQSVTVTPVSVIPHGIDKAFYKMDEASKKAARAELFKKEDWQNAFIILNANKICERKRIDLTLQAFQLFAQDKPDVRLYLHHSHIAPHYHERLENRLQNLGLQHKVTISPSQSTLMAKEQLNLLYNACDLGINTSAGEGWGLVSFEHAATGAAQIVPDHSACTELWKDSAELIPTKSHYQVKDRPDMLMCEIDVIKAVESLSRFYYDNKYKQTMAEKAYGLAHLNRYKWSNIGQEWCKLFFE